MNRIMFNSSYLHLFVIFYFSHNIGNRRSLRLPLHQELRVPIIEITKHKSFITGLI